MDKHVPFVVTPKTTRAEVQAAIITVRHLMRTAVIPSTEREYDPELNYLLNALLLLEPEPA